jgi:hypothetical protein
MRVRVVAIGVALAFFGTASIASAKDICVLDSFGPDVLIFKNVRVPKPPKPGKSIKARTIPLTGFFMTAANGSDAAVVHGAAIVKTTGAIRVGVTAQGTGALGVTTDVVFESMDVDQTFVGTGYYSFPGHATTASTWKPLDCATITLP